MFCRIKALGVVFYANKRASDINHVSYKFKKLTSIVLKCVFIWLGSLAWAKLVTRTLKQAQKDFETRVQTQWGGFLDLNLGIGREEKKSFALDKKQITIDFASEVNVRMCRWMGSTFGALTRDAEDRDCLARGLPGESWTCGSSVEGQEQRVATLLEAIWTPEREGHLKEKTGWNINVIWEPSQTNSTCEPPVNLSPGAIFDGFGQIF